METASHFRESSSRSVSHYSVKFAYPTRRTILHYQMEIVTEDAELINVTKWPGPLHNIFL
jgi:hypothetical protein